MAEATALHVPDGPAALSIQSLSKTFSGVRVLNDVSLEIAPGEVHALLGQNGCGKSTLIKCLAGVHRPDAGSAVDVNGRRLPHSYTPSEAHHLGLAFVHQDLGLVYDMTVAENLALGSGFERSGPVIRWSRQRRCAEEILEQFGLAVSPDAVVRDLPATVRSLLAIARAFQHRHGLETGRMSCLILDEPTAALPDQDAELLFEAIGRVTAAGVGVGYVTHRLEEVFRIATRATILRNGHKVETCSIAESTRESLASMIIGHSARSGETSGFPATAATMDTASKHADRPVVLDAAGLSGSRVRNASLHVRAGEIVGIAGLAGSGRSELARLLFGSQPLTAGARSVDAKPIFGSSPRQAIRAGVALVPEDRRREGCVLTMNIAENVTMAKPAVGRAGLLSLRQERRRVREAIERFDIRPADPDSRLDTLSGGNQQKVVLAKWLARSPQVLILDEPVQGVDIGAKAEIFSVLQQAAASGTALLVIDSDFDNLVSLCDRVYVLRNGRISEELAGSSLTASHISAAAFGVAGNAQELIASQTSKEAL
ncbi:ribose transport system ATP-binding protein [Streptomyces sp. B3I8]|nr:ribose transport system ATP-binding protein [Streptomyces sp. B3I8]